MTTAYGPHCDPDDLDTTVPHALRVQRRQINAQAHVSRAATEAAAGEMERARPAPATDRVVMPRCCGRGFRFCGSEAAGWLFSCEICHRTLAVLDGTREEVIDRII